MAEQYYRILLECITTEINSLSITLRIVYGLEHKLPIYYGKALKRKHTYTIS